MPFRFLLQHFWAENVLRCLGILLSRNSLVKSGGQGLFDSAFIHFLPKSGMKFGLVQRQKLLDNNRGLNYFSIFDLSFSTQTMGCTLTIREINYSLQIKELIIPKKYACFHLETAEWKHTTAVPDASPGYGKTHFMFKIKF